MASNNVGTNLSTETGDPGVFVSLTDVNGDAIFGYSPSASMPSADAGYAKGCLLINTTSGSPFVNVGTRTSSLFLTIVS